MKDIFFIGCLLLLPLFGYSQEITKYNPQELYEQKGGLFDIDSVRTISIDFYNTNYHKILTDNWFANSKKRLPAKIKISNGMHQAQRERKIMKTTLALHRIHRELLQGPTRLFLFRLTRRSVVRTFAPSIPLLFSLRTSMKGCRLSLLSSMLSSGVCFFLFFT